MHISTGTTQSTFALLQLQFRVIVAIMLRDIRTRFFGHGVGYLVMIGWPLVHILILLAIFTLLGRSTPYGESLTLFFATGLVPFMAYSYISRWTMMALIFNKALLAFPVIKTLDVLFARTLLEALGHFCSIILLLFILWMFGIDFMPMDLVQACYALGAAMLLGAGFGIVNGIIAMAVPTWGTGYALVIVAMYMISGIYFVPSAMPEIVRYLLSFNPVLQTVEWMRSAYYEGYSTILDKSYAIWFGLVHISVGLVIERFVRGHLLMAR
ncbi:hypothetical protein FHP25_13595 [Vineibacter terrae]|uniref:ABC-2 type transporter transmembrane domain-containing protein n=1 Tax=Vineibacter terrae TaxID=2586908 RepID=A0A5C8PNS6_9HYPH|nr:ABC transporter permease [Vineibacter terrae]TXL75681.1 hypothetical protein FHP25_13595 [Vineibacter terrae]